MENDFSYKGPDGRHYHTVKDYVWTGVMGFCGCYDEGLYDRFFEILEKLWRADQTKGSYFYEHEGKSNEDMWLQELIRHCLDSKDIIEHGSSVRGGWLSEKGKTICKELFP